MFGQHLRMVRIDAGFQITQHANAAALHKMTIINWEQRRINPMPYNLARDYDLQIEYIYNILYNYQLRHKRCINHQVVVQFQRFQQVYVEVVTCGCE